jgi:hypothetical protein
MIFLGLRWGPVRIIAHDVADVCLRYQQVTASAKKCTTNSNCITSFEGSYLESGKLSYSASVAGAFGLGSLSFYFCLGYSVSRRLMSGRIQVKVFTELKSEWSECLARSHPNNWVLLGGLWLSLGRPCTLAARPSGTAANWSIARCKTRMSKEEWDVCARNRGGGSSPGSDRMSPISHPSELYSRGQD